MIRLRIKNFGPILEGLTDNDGWIEFKRVTVFVGNQGSGKSTIAKLFSTFLWMEKSLVRGDSDPEPFEREGRFKQLLAYHRMEDYLHISGTKIQYQGYAYNFYVEDDQLRVESKGEAGLKDYPVPQIMYVPAERNFISYVKHPKELKLSSEALKEFLVAFEDAKSKMTDAIQLPINGSSVEYDKPRDILRLTGPGHNVRLTDASSGFQSIVPLFLTSQHLARTVLPGSDVAEPMSAEQHARFKEGAERISNMVGLTGEQLRIALSVLAKRFNKTAFLNIVEEPEQNLFPSSQWELLKSLLGISAQRPDNRLMLTTHSPYIVSYLTLSVEAYLLESKIRKAMNDGNVNFWHGPQHTPFHEDLLKKLENIVPSHARIAPSALAIYESADTPPGLLKKLPTLDDGLPTDVNQLNQLLEQTNSTFDDLLALEDDFNSSREQLTFD